MRIKYVDSTSYKKLMKGKWGGLSGKKKDKPLFNQIIRSKLKQAIEWEID
ncbi:MAG TPA: hypothetical protein VMV86_06765 [Methanosarcinales archaeon]|nr:hypothetical protein [Methanosarcinales archaeon]